MKMNIKSMSTIDLQSQLEQLRKTVNSIPVSKGFKLNKKIAAITKELQNRY